MRILNYMSKKEKKKLILMINNTRLNDEDSVYDLAVELCRWSVRLRSEILRRSEEEEL